MNKRFTIVAAAGIMVAASAGFALAGGGQPGDGLPFTYRAANEDLQLLLVGSDIHMSSPLKLNGFSIAKYCTFFSDRAIQDSIEYCTSTELLDSKGGFLGNIQMVGSNRAPEYVIAAIQVDPAASQSGDLKTVIGTMVDTLVCACWEDRSPGGFATVSDWVDAAQEHHASAAQGTSKSEISGLADRDLLLEVTTNRDGHLWKFVIS